MKALLFFSSFAFLFTSGMVSADCFSTELEKLKKTKSYSVVGEEIHSPSCGGCCALPSGLGGCSPPKRETAVSFEAPSGYRIMSKNFKSLKTNGNGDAGWGEDVFNGDYKVKVALGYWTKSENKPAGAGATRQYEIYGNYQKIITEGDYISIAKKCAK
jgi:hypothetical protein